MELLNKLQKAPRDNEQDKAILHEAICAVVQMLNPITPHISHALWQLLGNNTDIEQSGWPQVDNNALVEDEKLIIVQVNGKLRAKITIPADANQEQVETLAFAESNVKQFTDDKTVRKVIFVPGKLLNIVAN
jgi:leucyl-tRNA synthetase